MIVLRVVALLIMACAAAISPAHAQDATTLKKEMIGQWELSTTERSKTCVVTMKGDAAAQGFKLELEPACKTALPFTKDIVAWSLKGLDIVRLQDATGEAVIDFTEVEAGIFEGLRQGEGVYILQDLAAGLDVFAAEPSVPEELKTMQNVVLLPHIGSASVVTRNAMDQLVVDNLKSWFGGKAPLTPVAETPFKGR